MKIQDAIDKLLAYHPTLDREVTCDGFKCGNPEDELTGIVTTCCASVDVIRKAAELGANLILTHEPTFYTHFDPIDWLQGKNPIFDEKWKLCQENGIAIFRDHDHIHAHNPDGIFTGVMKELGWESYLACDPAKPMRFVIPPKTVRELALELKEKIGLNGVRVIGNMDAVVTNVAMGGHIMAQNHDMAATELFAREDVDVLIPGEVIDWTTVACARDAGQLGMNKAIINLGHFSWEELGMKHAAGWMAELIDHAVPVTFVPSVDMYQFL